MDLGPHAFFIVAAYAATAIIVAGLVLRAVLDHRAQRRALAELEGRGMRRRSERFEGSTLPGEERAKSQAAASRTG